MIYPKIFLANKMSIKILNDIKAQEVKCEHYVHTKRFLYESNQNIKSTYVTKGD